MTPTELKVQTLKKLGDRITQYMDGETDDIELIATCVDIINEFISQHGEL